jgi:Kef-type K+ transport system membrane component KefB
VDPVLVVGIIIIVGFIFGEIAIKIKLPKITGYILAGIFLNPGIMGFMPHTAPGRTNLIINLALCFITFSIGGTLQFSRLKKLGKSILWITICEAEFAFFIVAIGFLSIAHFFIQGPSISWFSTYIPFSILLGCIASPTDPTPALAITHEYNTKGDVTSTIMGVGASDDALGIMNFSLAVVVAQSFVRNIPFSLYSSIAVPLMIIFGSLLLGTLFGLLLNVVTKLVAKESEGVLIVVIFGLLSCCFGIADVIKCDALLATMVMGIIVVNFNPKHEKIFKVLERYTEELIFLVFFTVSGMQLDFSVLPTALIMIIFFVLFRGMGKVFGTACGGAIAKAPGNVRKYTAGGLIPYGGIVVGLALLMKQNAAFSGFADIIIAIVIGATIISEVIGSVCVKIALKKAGEIR